MYLSHHKEVFYIDTLSIIITAVVAVVVFILAFILGISYRKKIAEAEIGSAEEQARTLVNDAVKAAEKGWSTGKKAAVGAAGVVGAGAVGYGGYRSTHSHKHRR